MVGSTLLEILVAGLALLATPTQASTTPAAAASTPATPITRANLAAAIDAIIGDKALAGATVGVVVIDTQSREVLYRHEADAAINPASNIKLVTTAAALSLLGPEHRYLTRLFTDRGARKAGVIDGDLYLRGTGDPWLVTGDLYELAGDLRALGITSIKGGIVVDATAFDRDELPPAFDQKEEFAAFRAMSSAASVNFNTFAVHVRPAEAVGGKAIAVVEPPLGSIKVRSEVETVAGSRNRVQVEREASESGESLVFTGTLGIDAGPGTYRYPVKDPTAHAGEVMRLVLGQRGIKVGKSTIRAGAVPSDAEALATHASHPLSTLCRGVNKHSNNFMAEQILKSLDASEGHPATFEGALVRLREHLRSLGVDGEGLRLTNGSGLYDANRITAAQLTKLLVAAYNDFRISADYLASLPILGADGTLRSRGKESAAQRYVRAKTGTLNEASALSGYAGAIGKPPLAFSILIGDIKRSQTRAARDAQNRIAELLAEVAAAETAAAKG